MENDKLVELCLNNNCAVSLKNVDTFCKRILVGEIVRCSELENVLAAPHQINTQKSDEIIEQIFTGNMSMDFFPVDEVAEFLQNLDSIEPPEAQQQHNSDNLVAVNECTNEVQQIDTCSSDTISEACMIDVTEIISTKEHNLRRVKKPIFKVVPKPRPLKSDKPIKYRVNRNKEKNEAKKETIVRSPFPMFEPEPEADVQLLSQDNLFNSTAREPPLMRLLPNRKIVSCKFRCSPNLEHNMPFRNPIARNVRNVSSTNATSSVQTRTCASQTILQCEPKEPTLDSQKPKGPVNDEQARSEKEFSSQSNIPKPSKSMTQETFCQTASICSQEAFVMPLLNTIISSFSKLIETVCVNESTKKTIQDAPIKITQTTGLSNQEDIAVADSSIDVAAEVRQISTIDNNLDVSNVQNTLICLNKRISNLNRVIEPHKNKGVRLPGQNSSSLQNSTQSTSHTRFDTNVAQFEDDQHLNVLKKSKFSADFVSQSETCVSQSNQSQPKSIFETRINQHFNEAPKIPLNVIVHKEGEKRVVQFRPDPTSDVETGINSPLDDDDDSPMEESQSNMDEDMLSVTASDNLGLNDCEATEFNLSKPVSDDEFKRQSKRLFPLRTLLFNINENPESTSEFVMARLFQGVCPEYLKGICSVKFCPYLHTLHHKTYIRDKLETVSDEALLEAYNFARANKRLFRFIVLIFVDVFAKRKLKNELMNIILDYGILKPQTPILPKMTYAVKDVLGIPIHEALKALFHRYIQCKSLDKCPSWIVHKFSFEMAKRENVGYFINELNYVLDKTSFRLNAVALNNILLQFFETKCPDLASLATFAMRKLDEASISTLNKSNVQQFLLLNLAPANGNNVQK